MKKLLLILSITSISSLSRAEVGSCKPLFSSQIAIRILRQLSHSILNEKLSSKIPEYKRYLELHAQIGKDPSELEQLHSRLRPFLRLKALQIIYSKLFADLFVYRHSPEAHFEVFNPRVELSLVETRRWIRDNFIGTTGTVDDVQMDIILDAIALELSQRMNDRHSRRLTTEEINKRLIYKINRAWIRAQSRDSRTRSLVN